MGLKSKRIYDPPERSDGTRVLVDRLWPRGVSRERAALDHWAKAVAPSDALRRWYGHAPERWVEFQARYRAELAEPEAAAELARLAEMARDGSLTLLTATHGGSGSHLAVLERLLAAT